jgi:hypothetical protein
MSERAVTGRLIVDYRALVAVPPDELRAARERWLMQGEDMDRLPVLPQRGITALPLGNPGSVRAPISQRHSTQDRALFIPGNGSG